VLFDEIAADTLLGYVVSYPPLFELSEKQKTVQNSAFSFQSVKIVPEITYYVSSGTLNPTHSLLFQSFGVTISV